MDSYLVDLLELNSAEWMVHCLVVVMVDLMVFWMVVSSVLQSVGL